MDLGRYLSTIRNGWHWLLLAVAVGVALGLGVTMMQTPSYQATSTVFLTVNRANTTSELTQGANYAQSAALSFSKMARMPVVLDPVIKELGLQTTAKQLANSVGSETVVDTTLINISVNDGNPTRAAQIANAIAEQLGRSIKDLSPTGANPSEQAMRSELVSPAQVPKYPQSPSRNLNVMLGVIAAVGLTSVLLLLWELLDTRIRGEDDLAGVSGAPVLASVPYTPGDKDAAFKDQSFARAEAYRQLRTNIQYLDLTDGLGSLVVTSCQQGEGKTSTAISLAETTTGLGVSVLLVDADLRRPTIHKRLGIEGSAGLSTILAGMADPADVVQPFGDMHVLPAGQIPPNPSELLGSLRMANLIDQLTEVFDLVILDTAPVLPVTDPAVLGMICDGALLVVNSRKTSKNQVARAIGILRSTGARVLGSVLNNRKPVKHSSYVAEPEKNPTWVRRARGGEAEPDVTALEDQPHEPVREVPVAGKSPVPPSDKE